MALKKPYVLEKIDTIESSLADIVTLNIKQFGALCDGVHDDTTAFNNAITALPNGGTLLIPIGTILISSTITVNKPIIIKGTSKKGSIIKKNGSFKGLILSAGNIELRDFSMTSVVGDTTTGVEVGTYSAVAGLCRVTNVYIEKMGSHGIWLRNGNCCDIDIETFANIGDGVRIESNCDVSFGLNTNSNKIKANCIGNNGNGVYISNSSVNNVLCDCEGNASFGVYINGQHNEIFSYSEGNTSGTLKLDTSAYGNQIFGKLVDADPVINNQYNLICANTNTTTALYLYGNAKIKYVGRISGTAVVPGGSIPANSTISIDSASWAYVDSSSSLAFSTTSLLPDGLIIQAFPVASGTKITMKLTNVTSNPISLANFVWNCVYYNCL